MNRIEDPSRLDEERPAAPARQRSQGFAGLRLGCPGGGGTRVLDMRESGPLRLRLPRRPEGALEAVLLNTAGGIACGDAFAVEATLDPGADLVLTTIAAEKVYRSDGPVSTVATRARLAAGARLAFLPQETILFDRSALDRRFEADLAADARLLAFEAVVFGRAARHEAMTQGRLVDAWRIRRAGRLVVADTLRLEGALGDLLDRTAIGAGARAMATLIDVSPQAEGRLDEMRAHLDAAGANVVAGVEAGASAWNGHLVARFLGRDADALKAVAIRVLVAYRGVPMPRVWQS
ncbi:urease accessory protein UreD [Methylobacterium sp. Leaf108]|uniref:urease accessory protein UreD n=1 Tax=Methylobacterium sp. Leaf108 TaxID=1736256 RepID=UPI000A79BFCF|nr:urease accessory protein UreD [Methylobacterium sp. Leaf108]